MNKIVLSDQLNEHIARPLAKSLGLKYVHFEIERFGDGETKIKNIPREVENAEIILVKSTAKPVNENFVSLLLTLDAVFRVGGKTHLILPYMGYQRQDRIDDPIEPLSAKAVAKAIESQGIESVIVVDLHQAHIIGFFDSPVWNITTSKAVSAVLQESFQGIIPSNSIIVSADGGGYFRSNELSIKTGIPFLVAQKVRAEDGSVTYSGIDVDLKGKSVVVTEDIIASGSTLVALAKETKSRGASKFIAFCTHCMDFNKARSQLENSEIDQLFVFDTTGSLPPSQGKITVLKSSDLIADFMQGFLRLDGLSQ